MKPLKTVSLKTNQNNIASRYFSLPSNTYTYNPYNTVISVRNCNMTAKTVENISFSASHFCVRKREEV